MNNIRVYCKNTNEFYEVEPRSTLNQLSNNIRYNSEYPPLAALVDNQLKGLDYELLEAHSIEFIDISHPDGKRTYIRSLSLLLQKSIEEIYPDYQLIIDYALPSGIYCELTQRPTNSEQKPIGIKLSEQEIDSIKQSMLKLISNNIPIIKTKLTNQEAISLFKSRKQFDKANLIKSIGKHFISVYYIENYGDTFYGPMLSNTNLLDVFDIIPFNTGFCLRIPSSYPPFKLADNDPAQKLADVFMEHSKWCEIIGAKGIGTINNATLSGNISEVIQIAEVLHMRKYAAIADKIYENRDQIKLVLIAGPSSSGKTTTSKRITLHLKVLGLNPIVIAMDNYFVNREETPLDENGNYDFESLGAMDLELLNTHLNRLLAGEEVEVPKFNFTDGKRYYDGTKLKINEGDILIMEGIHGLNPTLTKDVNDNCKYHIYASALTSLSIDENNYISTSDSRLIRRMVRDNNFRGATAEQTILRWKSVRDGEHKYIFPYQENADVMFNSALIYELPLLKYFAEPLLRRITPNSPAYAESLRLLKFLSYILELNPNEHKEIPPTSVMREFIGGSTLDV